MSANQDKYLDVEKLLTTAEAANQLSVSERTLWTWTNEGKIDTVQVGRVKRYRRSELVRFAEANTISRRNN